LARFSQFDLSSDKSKLISDSAKPRVSISIDIQEEKNANLQEKDCSTRKNYCKHNQDWQTTIPQPFYVEEPRWIDIDVDYIDSPRVDNSDPYILTRGKKIYGINDSGKTIEDHEATLDYLSKNKKLLIKNRVRRSAKTNEGSWDKTADEKNRIKNRNYYDSLRDKDTNNTAIIEVENKGKKSFKIDNRQTITDFAQRQKIQREDISNDNENDSNKTAKIGQTERLNNSKNHFAININKKSVLLKNQKLPESRKKREIYDANSKIDVEKNKIETYEPMKNKVYINKLNNFDASDLFTLSQDKDLINGGIESLKDTDRSKFIERTWKLHYAHRKKLESERGGESEEDKSEINKDNTEITDSQLTNSINSETKVSNREKRNVCKVCKIKSQLQQDKWLKDIEKKIQESLSLERRDKHSDILERLSLSEPYIISRGKKAPQDFGKDDLSSNSRYEDRAKVTSLPVAESLLRTLLMKMSIQCNNDDCDINVNRLSPRDRRGTLDEIFAAYDPYYVARGKRMNGNQKGVLFETDARQ